MSTPANPTEVPTKLPSGAAVAPPAESGHVTGQASTTSPPEQQSAPSFDAKAVPHAGDAGGAVGAGASGVAGGAVAGAPVGAGTGAGAGTAAHHGVGHGTEGGFLQQARDIAKPYLDQVEQTTRPYIEKAQASAKPYTDAAIAKTAELKKTYIDGKQPPVGEYVPEGDENAARTSAPAAGAAGGAAAGTTAIEKAKGMLAHTTTTGIGAAAGPTAVEKAKGMFDYGIGSLKSAVNQLGETIDNKTATPEKPGLFTQASSVASMGYQSIQKSLGQPVPTTTSGGGVVAPPLSASAFHTKEPASASGASPATAAASGAGAPAADAHPILTTTNAVAHNSKEGDAQA